MPLRTATHRGPQRPVQSARVQWPAVESRHHPPVKSQLRALIEPRIEQAIAALRDQGILPADFVTPDFVVERPKDRSHGDASTNAAMLLARHATQNGARSNPRAVAQALVAAIPADDDIASIEIAGPGFLNFRLTPAAWQRQLVAAATAAMPAAARARRASSTCRPTRPVRCMSATAARR